MLSWREPLQRWPAWARRLLFGIIASLLMGLGLVLGLYLYFAPTVPRFDSVHDYHPKIGSRIYAHDGTLIGDFSEERRVVLSFDRIPPLLAQAFVSAEDKRFYKHGGVDPIGTLKAVVDKLLRPSSKLRGASTITQQVAKSLLVSRSSYEAATERSLTRKIREAILARRLESVMSKEEILWLYLNQIFLGHRAHGVQAAAEHYFRKNAWEMSLAEMATLAGLPQRPSDYSPFLNPESAMGRRRYVLSRLYEDGHIDQTQLDAALAEELQVYPVRERYLQIAPYYTEQVRRMLVDDYGSRSLAEEGLEVRTAMQMGPQHWAQNAVNKGLWALDKRQGFRGPLATIDAEKRGQFLRKYREELGLTDTAELQPEYGRRYLAMVTGFKDSQTVLLNVAGLKGYLPLAGMRWAREPNPIYRFDNHYVENVRTRLQRGDVIEVVLTDLTRLSKDPHAGPAINAAKKLEGRPLFALQQEPIAQAALMGVDPWNGYVTAQVGGYYFEQSSFNRATQACREPGSAFKPIVYSAAIDKLDYTASTLIDDKPLIYDDPDNESRWKPNNAGLEFKGEIPLRQCLMDSINTPAIRIAEAVGIRDTIQHARNMGIKTPLKEELGTALGSSCTYLSNLMQVYATLNQYGRRKDLVFVTKVVDRYGHVLADHSAPGDATSDLEARLDRSYEALLNEAPEVLDAQSAFLTVSLMTNVIQHGTGLRARRLDVPLAGKTGTTDDAFDAWFMAFSRDLVAGAWVGHDKKERPLGINEQGGRTALPIWYRFMDASTRDYTKPGNPRLPASDFAPPLGVIEAAIDPATGLLAREEEGAVFEWYRQGTQPTEYALETGIADANNETFWEAE